MSLRELFPVYPLTLKSPRKFKIKFGTRRLYVDLPWPSYYFLQVAMSKAVKVGLTKEEVKEEWNKFLQHNRDILTFHGKPFISVSLRSTPFSEKEFLRLDVRWRLFNEYLEEKAICFLSKIEKGGENIMKVYQEIWSNFFAITGILEPPKPGYFPASREIFRKLLKRTGDYYQLERLLDDFEGIIVKVEKVMKDKIPSIQLYTTNLIMDIQHLRTLVDVVNIPAAYLLLRNLLESFVKLFVYYDIGKFIDNPDLILSSMFLYEYEATGEALKKPRIYSLRRFRDKLVRKLPKIAPSNNLLNVIKRLKKLQIPTLGVKLQVLKEFSEVYRLDVGLDKLYSACSSVIHNQPPLPFFSLLEVKFFKRFLEKYLNSIQIVAEKLIGRKIKIRKMLGVSIPESDKPFKECLKVVHKLWGEHDSEIKDLIKRALAEVKGFWVRPLTLTAVFHLISPSFTRLRKLFFMQEDLKDVVEKLEPISFRIGLSYEVYETLNALQEVLTSELEKHKTFSSLSEEQKKATVFYLLSLYLPEVVEEMVKKK